MDRQTEATLSVGVVWSDLGTSVRVSNGPYWDGEGDIRIHKQATPTTLNAADVDLSIQLTSSIPPLISSSTRQFRLEFEPSGLATVPTPFELQLLTSQGCSVYPVSLHWDGTAVSARSSYLTPMRSAVSCTINFVVLGDSSFQPPAPLCLTIATDAGEMTRTKASATIATSNFAINYGAPSANAGWNETGYATNIGNQFLALTNSDDTHTTTPFPAIPNTGGFTMAAWIRWDDATPNSVVLDLGNGAWTNNILVARGETDPTAIELRIASTTNGVYQRRLIIPGVIIVGVWSHLALVFDFSGSSLSCFVNGVQLSNLALSGLTLPVGILTHPTLQAGDASFAGAFESFVGCTASFIVWSNQMLTHAQVMGLWNTRPTTITPALKDPSAIFFTSIITYAFSSPPSTPTSGVVWSPPPVGVVSGRVTLDGVTGYIDLQDWNNNVDHPYNRYPNLPSTIEMEDGITLEGWFLLEASSPSVVIPGTSRLWAMGTKVEFNSMEFMIGAMGELTYRVWVQEQPYSISTATPFLLQSRWTHLAVTHDQNQTATIYVNGVVAAQGTVQRLSSLLLMSSFLMSGNSELGFTGGAVGQFSMYDRALDPITIATLTHLSPASVFFSPLTLITPDSIDFTPNVGTYIDILLGGIDASQGGSPLVCPSQTLDWLAISQYHWSDEMDGETIQKCQLATIANTYNVSCRITPVTTHTSETTDGFSGDSFMINGNRDQLLSLASSRTTLGQPRSTAPWIKGGTTGTGIVVLQGGKHHINLRSNTDSCKPDTDTILFPDRITQDMTIGFALSMWVRVTDPPVVDAAPYPRLWSADSGVGSIPRSILSLYLTSTGLRFEHSLNGVVACVIDGGSASLLRWRTGSFRHVALNMRGRDVEMWIDTSSSIGVCTTDIPDVIRTNVGIGYDGTDGSALAAALGEIRSFPRALGPLELIQLLSLTPPPTFLPLSWSIDGPLVVPAGSPALFRMRSFVQPTGGSYGLNLISEPGVMTSPATVSRSAAVIKVTPNNRTLGATIGFASLTSTQTWPAAGMDPICFEYLQPNANLASQSQPSWAVDFSSAGSHAAWAAGIASFDGVAQYYDLTNAADSHTRALPALGASWSISTWSLIRSVDDRVYFNSTLTLFEFHIGTGGMIRLSSYRTPFSLQHRLKLHMTNDAGVPFFQLHTFADLTAHGWHHIVVTFNRIRLEVTLSIDGASHVAGFVSQLPSTAAPRIGQLGRSFDGTTADNFFPGQIAYFGIHNVSLTPAAIVSLWFSPPSSIASLVRPLRPSLPSIIADSTMKLNLDNAITGTTFASGAMPNTGLAVINSAVQGIDLVAQGIPTNTFAANYSLELWFSTGPYPSVGTLPMGSLLSCGSAAYSIGVSLMGNQLFLFDSEGQYPSNIDQYSLPSWQHLVVTYDSLNGFATVYLNGGNLLRSISFNPNRLPLPTLTNCRIGGTTMPLATPFIGTIAGFRVWNRLVQPIEVEVLGQYPPDNIVQPRTKFECRTPTATLPTNPPWNGGATDTDLLTPIGISSIPLVHLTCAISDSLGRLSPSFSTDVTSYTISVPWTDPLERTVNITLATIVADQMEVTFGGATCQVSSTDANTYTCLTPNNTLGGDVVPLAVQAISDLQSPVLSYAVSVVFAPAPACFGVTCENGGTCENVPNPIYSTPFTCDCQPGFTDPTCSVIIPPILPQPLPTIVAPDAICACNTLTVSGSVTYDIAAPSDVAPIFVWSLDSMLVQYGGQAIELVDRNAYGFNPSLAASTIAALAIAQNRTLLNVTQWIVTDTPAQLVIPADAIFDNSTLRLNLTVVGAGLGVGSTSHAITKLSPTSCPFDWMPTLAILPTGIVTRAEVSIFDSIITRSTCAPLPINTVYTYGWTVAAIAARAGYPAINSLPADEQQRTSAGKTFTIQSGFFRVGYEYQVSVTVRLSGSFDSFGRRLLSSLSAPFSVTLTATLTGIVSTPTPIVAKIAGGDRSRSTAYPILFDGAQSYDPDYIHTAGAPTYPFTFTWRCESNGTTVDLGSTSLTQSSLTIPSQLLSPGSYVITLTIRSTSDSRTAADFRQLYVTPEPIAPTPIVKIFDLPTHLNRDEPITIVTQVDLPTTSTGTLYGLTYSWTISDPTIDLTNSSNLLGSVNGSTLTLTPSVLTPGETYTITVTVYDPVENTHSSSSITFTVDPVPIIGPPPAGCTVQPSSGIALQTEFTLACQGIYTATSLGGDAQPLQYSWQYQLPQSSLQQVSAWSISSTTNVLLPVGDLTLHAYVRDRFNNSIKIVAGTVTVTAPPVPIDRVAYLANLTHTIIDPLVASGDAATALPLIKFIADELALIEPATQASADLRDYLWSLIWQLLNAMPQGVTLTPADALLYAQATVSLSAIPQPSAYVPLPGAVDPLAVMNLLHTKIDTSSRLPTAQSALPTLLAQTVSNLLTQCDQLDKITELMTQIVSIVLQGRGAGEQVTLKLDNMNVIIRRGLLTDGVQITLEDGSYISLAPDLLVQYAASLNNAGDTNIDSASRQQSVNVDSAVVTYASQWSACRQTGDSDGATNLSPIVDITLKIGNTTLDWSEIQGPITFALPLSANDTDAALAAAASQLCAGETLNSTDYLNTVATCAFWDTSLNAYSTAGCTSAGLVTNPLTGQTQFACSCVHLTEFQILLEQARARELGCKVDREVMYAVLAVLYLIIGSIALTQLSRILMRHGWFGLKKFWLMSIEHGLILALCIFRALNSMIFYSWNETLSIRVQSILVGLPFLCYPWIWTFVGTAWLSILNASNGGRRESNPFEAYKTRFIIGNMVIIMTLVFIFGSMAFSGLDTIVRLNEAGTIIIAIIQIGFSLFIGGYGFALVSALTKDFVSPYAKKLGLVAGGLCLVFALSSALLFVEVTAKSIYETSPLAFHGAYFGADLVGLAIILILFAKSVADCMAPGASKISMGSQQSGSQPGSHTGAKRHTVKSINAGGSGAQVLYQVQEGDGEGAILNHTPLVVRSHDDADDGADSSDDSSDSDSSSSSSSDGEDGAGGVDGGDAGGEQPHLHQAVPTEEETTMPESQAQTQAPVDNTPLLTSAASPAGRLRALSAARLSRNAGLASPSVTATGVNVQLDSPSLFGRGVGQSLHSWRVVDPSAVRSASGTGTVSPAFTPVRMQRASSLGSTNDRPPVIGELMEVQRSPQPASAPTQGAPIHGDVEMESLSLPHAIQAPSLLSVGAALPIVWPTPVAEEVTGEGEHVSDEAVGATKDGVIGGGEDEFPSTPSQRTPSDTVVPLSGSSGGSSASPLASALAPVAVRRSFVTNRGASVTAAVSQSHNVRSQSLMAPPVGGGEGATATASVAGGAAAAQPSDPTQPQPKLTKMQMIAAASIAAAKARRDTKPNVLAFGSATKK